MSVTSNVPENPRASREPPASWLDRLAHLVLPAPCLGCRAPLPARRSPLGLCATCRSDLPEIDPEAGVCARCSRPLAATASRDTWPPGWRCGPCRRRPPTFDRLIAVWDYRPPVDAVILGLKLRRLEYLGRHLGARMAVRLQDEAERDLDPISSISLQESAIVPVPLHWRRRLRRGYNQAEEIARPLARELGLPLRRCLRRRRATPRQTSLSRARRRRSPAGAFVGRRPPERTVVLVDDVATTGSTLEAAAAALKQAGVARVIALVAARTPRKSTDFA